MWEIQPSALNSVPGRATQLLKTAFTASASYPWFFMVWLSSSTSPSLSRTSASSPSAHSLMRSGDGFGQGDVAFPQLLPGGELKLGQTAVNLQELDDLGEALTHERVQLV